MGAKYNLAGKAINLLDSIRQTVALYASSGLDSLACSSQSVETIEKWGCGQLAPKGRGCRDCSLYKQGLHAVKGTGPVGARVMFVCGFPSEDAAQSGDTFSGEQGRLLARIVEAMKLGLNDVYVTHAVKCRPPGGRVPGKPEIGACGFLLEKEVSKIGPEVLCTMGEFSTRAVLGTQEPFDMLRGRFFERFGIKVMPTWHMADMMLNKNRKRQAWEDLQKVMELL